MLDRLKQREIQLLHRPAPLLDSHGGRRCEDAGHEDDDKRKSAHTAGVDSNGSATV
jgi:hypothetical protein